MNSGLSGTPGGKRRRRRRLRANAAFDRGPGAVGRLAQNIEPAIATAIAIARADIEECALILRQADNLAAHAKVRLALTRALDVEPRLFEAQHLLNAAARLHRVLRETTPNP
jgi:hypothetical protein